jgi:crossover junction endodeoxyribonuclease RuvC
MTSKPVNVIGLDLSLTKTGVAFCSSVGGHSAIETELIKSKPSGDQPLDELRRIIGIVHMIKKWVETQSKGRTVDLVALENLSFMSKGTSLTQLSGLSYFIREWLFMSSIPFVMVAPTSLKKFVTGKGNAEKDQIMMYVLKNWGIMSPEQNQADAIALSKIAEAMVADGCKLNKEQREVVQLLKKQIT